MNDTLIFLHLPRTGGTTLRDILSKQYSDKVTFENKTLLDTDQNFNAKNKSEKRKHKLIKKVIEGIKRNFGTKPNSSQA